MTYLYRKSGMSLGLVKAALLNPNFSPSLYSMQLNVSGRDYWFQNVVQNLNGTLIWQLYVTDSESNNIFDRQQTLPSLPLSLAVVTDEATGCLKALAAMPTGEVLSDVYTGLHDAPLVAWFGVVGESSPQYSYATLTGSMSVDLQGAPDVTDAETSELEPGFSCWNATQTAEGSNLKSTVGLLYAFGVKFTLSPI
jgi:hypothetical protein